MGNNNNGKTLRLGEVGRCDRMYIKCTASFGAYGTVEGLPPGRRLSIANQEAVEAMVNGLAIWATGVAFPVSFG